MTARPRIPPAVRAEEGSLFCPGCGGEFRAGIPSCVDCELELVVGPPPAGAAVEPLDPLALAVVFATGDLGLLAEAKLRLAGAGISYLARGEAGHDLLAAGRLAPGLRAAPMELLVRAGDWEAASALLLRAGLAPVEATPEEQKTGELWIAEEEQDEEPEEEVSASVPRSRWSFAEDRLRGFELALVLVVAFAPSLFGSTWNWWNGETGARSRDLFDIFYGLQKELICLLLLAYVLARRGKSFRDLGLTFRKTDLLVGLFLTLAGHLATLLAWRAMESVSLLATGHWIDIPPSHATAPVLGLAWVLGLLLTVAIGPFYEEMIARAFTMSEVEALTGSTGLAVAASVLLQTSYHLYLGLPNALAAGAAFLVSACYYARFRRITPVILAHALWNLYVALHRL
jgi:membrane protease YdiL (CAAX protease family)